MHGVRAMVMRGGTSKGLYFLADDLPADVVARDRFLLEAMGSPDPRQIDGMGGAHPLTSKVAVVAPSHDRRADVDYLFLQVVVDEAVVSDAQNCGNILAGVGPFAVERGLITTAPGATSTDVGIHMVNSGAVARARVPLRDGAPVYEGDCAIDGVPGTAAPIRIDFEDTAGSTCGALLPTGNPVDTVEGIEVTLVDNGMPVVVLRAADVGVTGYEDPTALEADDDLRRVVERVRLAAGPMMRLGDVQPLTVPKMTLVAPPREGGTISTRTFIPHRCHDAIGVLGAVSVATAVLLPDSPAAAVAAPAGPRSPIVVEHPTGAFHASVDLEPDGDSWLVRRAGISQTARKLMDGVVFGRS